MSDLVFSYEKKEQCECGCGLMTAGLSLKIFEDGDVLRTDIHSGDEDPLHVEEMAEMFVFVNRLKTFLEEEKSAFESIPNEMTCYDRTSSVRIVNILNKTIRIFPQVIKEKEYKSEFDYLALNFFLKRIRDFFKDEGMSRFFKGIIDDIK